MRVEGQRVPRDRFRDKILRLLNLRSEESERTLLMFTFYVVTAVGVTWLEPSTSELFLKRYGPDSLPWIYIASAGTSGLVYIYSWLPKILPLRWVIILIPLVLATPLLILHVGLTFPEAATLYGFNVLGLTIVLIRLWQEVITTLNDLNTGITANQLFNIREIKRASPLINGGVLFADTLGGFLLPLLLSQFKLPKVILLSGVMIAIGSLILLYLSQKYRQFFPDARRRRIEEEQSDSLQRRVQGPLQQYVILLFAFFIIAQVIFLIVDFQFQSQLDAWSTETDLGQKIGFAGFMGYFQGVLGIVEMLLMFASSRIIERLGVFTAVMLLPGIVFLLGAVSLTNLVPSFFIGVVILKFCNEALHYTLFTGTRPILFQPMPDSVRTSLQSIVSGNAEPLSAGATGIFLLGMLWLTKQHEVNVNFSLMGLIVSAAAIWLVIIWFLRARYVGLLVLGAERGQLSVSDVDLRELKRAVVEALNRPGTEADKRSCIELLTHIDPQNVGEVLAPLLGNLPPALQRQSLEAMMNHPSPAYLGSVRTLIDQPLVPEVLAVALRYVWLNEPELDIRQLRPYLRAEVDPVVRGTAASLVLSRGNPRQKAEATNTLRQMLTHKRERERVMGCRALGEADYMQALRLYIPNLLQDESLRVRRALLEAIASTRLEEYYPSLLRGLHYKSTREAAMRAIVRLGDEAIPILVNLAQDIHKPDLVQMCAWSAIGQIGTSEARSVLVSNLLTAWGKTRRNILSILIKMPQEIGINAAVDRLGRAGVETLIDQEILLIGQMYFALLDLNPEQLRGREVELLRRALQDVIADAVDRLFLLMKLLYPAATIQAAALCLQSSSRSSVARGLEILDHTLDIPSKQILLSLLDLHSEEEKIQGLSDMLPYRAITSSDRLRYLLDLRHFLSDWALACCFHLARQARWSLTPQQILACLRHPTGFVRESVLSYLSIVSIRALQELLPQMKNDPDRLVAAQVRQLMAEIEAQQQQTFSMISSVSTL